VVSFVELKSGFVSFRFMIDLKGYFPEILEKGSKWAADAEHLIRTNCSELNEHQISDARIMGVRAPEKIRVLLVPHIPRPEDGLLKLANETVHLITDKTAGLTLRYGIFILKEYARDRRLLLHEFVHVEQYERLGGFNQFLGRYLMECLDFGYPNAPLEREADERSGSLCQSKR
jgi:hypothetical protein